MTPDCARYIRLIQREHPDLLPEPLIAR